MLFAQPHLRLGIDGEEETLANVRMDTEGQVSSTCWICTGSAETLGTAGALPLKIFLTKIMSTTLSIY